MCMLASTLQRLERQLAQVNEKAGSGMAEF